MFKKTILVLIILGVLFVLGIQFYPPTLQKQTNPPVLSEPKWDSPKTREYAEKCCFDCHSNLTKWPWYSKVAPVSWKITKHVFYGRKRLNFTEWNEQEKKGNPEKAKESSDQLDPRLEKAIEEIEEGGMPLQDYLKMHKNAQLTDTQKEEFIAGLQKTK